MNFESFNFDPKVLAGVRAQGFVTPTPIQEKTIPPIMAGHDIIGLAQTGTGKTAAFVLPVLHRLMQGPRGVVRALIISPTRELAEQTCEAINVLAKYTGLRSISVYGGVAVEHQNRALSHGVELVVACPGRLLDHMLKGTIDLSRVETLIIDEADRMFDMGFLPDIRNIVRCITQPHQTLLFSATMPDDIKRLVQEVLHDPITVQIGFSAPAASVSHALYPVPAHLKTALLKEILKRTETDSVVIFARTKHRVERLADQLRHSGFKVASLQGDMLQYQRQAALDAFREGSLKIMVATDIAARGLDILSISHVINYDMPDSPDDYTHRIGRTGRVDDTGEAFSLVTDEDKRIVATLERILKKPIERRKIEGFDYGPEGPAAPKARAAGRHFRASSARHPQRHHHSGQRGRRPESQVNNRPHRPVSPASSTPPAL
jgi:ATP-dependent RNA helicase RhlE